MSEFQLKDALLSLFLRAEAEGHRDTAEHLLRALETLCAEPDAAAERRRPLDPNQGPPRRGDAVERGGRDGQHAARQRPRVSPAPPPARPGRS